MTAVDNKITEAGPINPCLVELLLRRCAGTRPIPLGDSCQRPHLLTFSRAREKGAKVAEVNNPPSAGKTPSRPREME